MIWNWETGVTEREGMSIDHQDEMKKQKKKIHGTHPHSVSGEGEEGYLYSM
jgi:hypothetical protein